MVDSAHLNPWKTRFQWWIYDDLILRSFKHTPGTYPRRSTSALWRNSFQWRVWGWVGASSRGMLGFSLIYILLTQDSNAECCLWFIIFLTFFSPSPASWHWCSESVLEHRSRRGLPLVHPMRLERCGPRRGQIVCRISSWAQNASQGARMGSLAACAFCAS